MTEFQSKINSSHLTRDAYLYIRQSSLKQVYNNTESTERQYALRQRAVSLGWPIEQVIVIDEDQGRSGAATDREGFQKLVAEVGMGRAGIVMGLEVSRLARNNTEWHRLLEICALTDTLILDEQGIYNPKSHNDRLLLGVKGSLSEAELYVIKDRLQGAKLTKALRGELRTRLPTGLVYNSKDEVVLEPDQLIRKSFECFFETFRRVGSARGVVKSFREQGLKIPRLIQSGFNKGEIVWVEVEESRVRDILHNPRYAGAYFYGRKKSYKNIEGKYSTKKLPRDQWCSFIKDAHVGYISWDEYERNLQRLRENSQAQGHDRKKSPPREGPALLQGLTVCGVCGRRMTIRYHSRKRGLVPNYVCQKIAISKGEKVCQDIAGYGVDEAISKVIIGVMTPVALEAALSVQKEIQSRIEEANKLRKKQVERARYEADLARRRYMEVDPSNRLVADTLEAEWNEKIRVLNATQEEYERQSKADRLLLDNKQKEQILSLASNFPKIWNNSQTPIRERKRMIRLIIEDVTLTKEKKKIITQIRFKGGAQKTLELRVPKMIWEIQQNSPEVVAEVDRLLDNHTYAEIAKILNEKFPESNKTYTGRKVARIRSNYKLKMRYDRLKEAGMLTQKEISKILGVCEITVRIWRDHGFLKAHPYDDKNQCLYEHPGDAFPKKMQGVKFSKRK